MTSRDELRQNTHRKVMAAAGRLFRQRGFKNTTIREIAAEAGVSIGSVMAVGDKSELLVTMYDSHIADVHQQRAVAARPATKSTTTNCADQIVAIIAPFLALFSEDADLAREYGAILMSGRHRSVVFSDLAAALQREIACALQESGMDAAQVPVAAKTVYLAYLGAIYFSAGTGPGDAAVSGKELHSIFTFVTR